MPRACLHGFAGSPPPPFPRSFQWLRPRIGRQDQSRRRFRDGGREPAAISFYFVCSDWTAIPLRISSAAVTPTPAVLLPENVPS